MSFMGQYLDGSLAADIEKLKADDAVEVGPTGGIVIIAGGNNITTSGAGSTITIDLTDTTNHAVQIGNATGSLTSLGIGLTGQVLKGNTAADPSWGAVDLTTDVTGLLPVGSGGTGVGTITAHTIPVGDGVNAINEIGVGTANQVLLSKGAGVDPDWSTATYLDTTTQGDLLYSSADNVLASLAKDATATRYIANTGAGNNPAWDQIDLTNGVTGTLPVANGGTGVATITAHTLLTGDGTNPINEIAVGSAGQVLQSQGAGVDPNWSTTTYPSTGAIGDLIYASGANTLAMRTFDNTATRYLANTGDGGTTPDWDQVNLTNGVTGTLPVSNGGTGFATTTAYAVICGGTAATNPLQAIASVGTADQVLTSNGAGALPTFQTITEAIAWTVTTVNASIVANNGYIANKAGLLTLTLPATGDIGDIIEVTNINTAVGFRIAQNVNQYIRFGDTLTTVGVGGYLEATALGDSVKLVCVVSGASTGWQVVSSIGNITIV